MIVFHTDLDNTIIYSYKHDIGLDKINVEWYQGRQISFVTSKTMELLNEIKEKVLMVPTSTRTIEQYERIDLAQGVFPYALVCNGGVLLRNGIKDEKWYQESLELVKESEESIMLGLKLLEQEPRRTFELRYIENLFLFTKCDSPEAVVEDLRQKLDLSLVEVFNNGTKVYVLPKALNKGNAVKRFKQIVSSDYIVAAGDSEFDIPMLKEADLPLAPFHFRKKYGVEFEVQQAKEEELFSEMALRECLKFYNSRM